MRSAAFVLLIGVAVAFGLAAASAQAELPAGAAPAGVPQSAPSAVQRSPTASPAVPAEASPSGPPKTYDPSRNCVDLTDANVELRSGRRPVGGPMQAHSDEPAKQLFLDFVYAPIKSRDGLTTGIFVEGVDVTEHIKNEDRLRLINAELQHRVKNTLAVVSAIAAQTFRGSNSDGVLPTFQGRLGAFAKAHDALTGEHGTKASIMTVIDGALAPHRTGEGRFSISGPPLILGPKQAVVSGDVSSRIGRKGPDRPLLN
jgi:two-component sensor histidine kinase